MAKMNPFTLALIALDIAACLWEVAHGCPAKGWYWISAASITASTLCWK